jgi:nucleoside-diphosphate-sugar epimerase
MLGSKRGPENSTFKKVTDTVYFGFHRLAINGLNDESNQPIQYKQLTLICNGEIYNVAGGNTVSVNDIKRKFQQKFNCEFEYTPTRQGDVFATHAELTKAANELGYHPNIQFDEGLQRTFEWWGI